ncbi:MAG: glutamyl-tRNA reductase, partial [Acidimicrobiales bacterium]
MSVVVIGINHRSAPLELLERMAVGDDYLGKALADLSSRSSLSEVVLVSTCMRTEVYAVAERFHGAIGDVSEYLSESSGTPAEVVSEHLYCFYEEGAVNHLFQVASGLDSAVLGEGEVLGQVRTAWERAREEGAAGPAISALFRHAVEVGKRARSETAISRGITSV